MNFFDFPTFKTDILSFIETDEENILKMLKENKPFGLKRAQFADMS